MTSILERRERVFGAGAPLFYRQPLHVVRGEGVYLFDVEGRRYLDMYNNVPSAGHGNPRIAAAMAQQQATLNVHARYVHEGAIAFAERLVALHGPEIESVVFSCSGTEANEIAMRMAQVSTGKRGVVCTNAAYHGNSTLVGALSPFERRRAASDAVRTFPTPQMYRPPALGADAHLDELAKAIAELEATGAGFSALMVCPIFANDGLPDIPAGFMGRASEMVRAAGGLVISDEVQSGYCRTGMWWGYQHSGLEPDIVVTGKAMGAGLPLAATLASRRLVEAFRAHTHYFNTCAGTPLQAAVGMAVLDAIEADGLAENAQVVGAALKAVLRERMARHARIGDVRGAGLFIGVEIVKGDAEKTPDRREAVEIVEGLKALGVLTSNAGVHSNVIKLRPPLGFSQENAESFIAAFDQVMAQARA
jgi:4-aminobutyrate aminotransferase-like enzyme